MGPQWKYVGYVRYVECPSNPYFVYKHATQTGRNVGHPFKNVISIKVYACHRVAIIHYQ